jgi:hypothetical protein
VHCGEEMPASEQDCPRVIRMDPQLRRSAGYVAAAIVLFVPLMTAVWTITPPRADANPLVAAIVLGVFFGLLALLPAVVFRWRLRIDQRGIARRRLFRFVLWPWEAFADGRIQRGAIPMSYVWKEQPLGGRVLGFDYVTQDDRDLLRRRCEAALAARSTIDAGQDGAETLRVSTPLSSQDSVIRWPATLEFSASGMSLTRRGKHQQFDWHDVREVRIIRQRRDRYDFLRLEIDVGDERLRLLEDARARWSGGDGAVLERILRKHLPSEKVLDISLTGRPSSQREFEFRLIQFEKSSRERAVLEWVTFGVCLATSLLLLYLLGQCLHRSLGQAATLNQILVESLAMTICGDFVLLLPLSLVLFAYLHVASRHKQQSADLEAWKEKNHHPENA